MLRAVARFDVRFRWPIVAVWIVGVVVAVRLLPGLTSVTHASNAQFLLPSSPSVQAAELARPREGFRGCCGSCPAGRQGTAWSPRRW